MRFLVSWFACLAVALAAHEGRAATSVGAQVFGGASIPIVQDDNDTGTIFGIRESGTSRTSGN